MGRAHAMSTRPTWIGKGIAVMVAAVGVAIAMPAQAEGSPFSFVSRLIGGALVLSAVFGFYELIGHALGRVVAKLFPQSARALDSPDETPVVRARFGAAKALLVFGAYLGAQLVVFIIIAVVAPSAGALSGFTSGDPRSGPWLAVSLLAGTGAGAAASIALTVRYAGALIRMPGTFAIGLSPVDRVTVLYAAIVAAFFSVVVVFVAPLLAVPDSKADFGPFVQLARSGGWVRFAGAFLAVVVAPPLEEFVFRGVLLAGLARSWNVPAAALTVTLLFLGAHLPYAARYWPAALAIIVMALFLLAVRLRTGSLLPGIAAHVTYNFVLSITAYASRH